MTHFFRLFSFFALTILLVSCTPTQKIRLDSRVIPDNTVFKYRQITIGETTLKTTEEVSVTREKSIQDFSYTFLRQDPDGSTKWRSDITRFQIERNENDSISRFDSDRMEKELDTIKLLIFSKLINTPFYFTVNSNGEIYELTGMDEIWASVADSIAPVKRPVFEMLAKDFGNRFVTESVKNTWSFYPSQKVHKGKSWKKESEIALFNAKTYTTYHLDEIYTNEVSISFVKVIKGDAKAPGELKMGPAVIKYYLNGKGFGKLRLDTVSGMMVKSESETIMEGKLEILIPYLAAQSMPVTIKTKTVLEQR